MEPGILAEQEDHSCWCARESPASSFIIPLDPDLMWGVVWSAVVSQGDWVVVWCSGVMDIVVLQG